MDNKVKRKYYCVVSGCSSTKSTEKLIFHRPPVNKTRYNQWCIALKVKKLPIFAVVCSNHFLHEDYYPAREGSRKLLKRDIVPSQNLPQSLISLMTKDPDLTKKKKRKKRLDNRNAKKFKQLEQQKEQNLRLNHQVEFENKEDESVKTSESCINDINSTIHDSVLEEDYTNVTTECESKVIDTNVNVDINRSDDTNVNVDINRSDDTNVNVNISRSDSDTAIKKTPSILDFFHTDAQLYTYTGIKSFAILDCLVECVDELRKGDRKNISTKNSVLLTFIKLKQNQSYTAVGILFNISSQLTKKYFITTLKNLAQVLHVLIRWPSKNEILNNMPKCFANYKSTRIILDSLEISIGQSKCLKCRIPTYSNYKSRHTVKFMIGVTPSGMISYISKGYGGRVSDKFIFKQSNILQRSIRCVDSIMVDRGFLIDKECADYGIKLIRPPFLKNKKQFTHKEAMRNASIASSRVHVERRIQRIRLFKILQGPLERLTNLDSPILAKDKFISNS